MTDDGIGDVAHEDPLQPSESTGAHHYQTGANVFGQVHDSLVSPFAHPQVGDSDGATRLFDLPDLFVQYLLGLASESLSSLLGLGVELVDGLGERAPDSDDVEP